MAIKESDFDVLGPHEVRHRATGATWKGGPYTTPEHSGVSLTEDRGRAGQEHFPTADELRPYAVALLHKLAKQGQKRKLAGLAALGAFFRNLFKKRKGG